MHRVSPFRRLRFERVEFRWCLSTIAFGMHNIECCSAQDLDAIYTSQPDSVTTADVDGDGDLDVLSVSNGYDSKLAWYENLDGQGRFGFQQVISRPGGVSVAAADFDGDGDVDVLKAGNGQFAWHANTDGRGHFGTAREIESWPEENGYRGYVTYLATLDLDGDGDLDVLSASSPGVWVNSGAIVWYQNLDGRGDFGARQLISTQTTGSNLVTARRLRWRRGSGCGVDRRRHP